MVVLIVGLHHEIGARQTGVATNTFRHRKQPEESEEITIKGNCALKVETFVGI